MNNSALYILSIIITVLVSGLSYKFLEKPFLKMKNKWSVLSANTVSQTLNNTIT